MQISETKAALQSGTFNVPIQVNDFRVPIQVNEIRVPIQVNDIRVPIQVNEIRIPMQINNFSFPMPINDMSIPIQINDNSDPIQINDNSDPMQINESSVPVQIIIPTHSIHNRTDDILIKKVDEIVNSYKLALDLTRSQAYLELSGYFRLFDPQTGSLCMLTKRMVMPIISKMTEEFQIFAMQQR